MSLGGLITGLILGGVVGAIAALLGSPRTGRENRERLAETVPSLRDQGPVLERAGDELRARIARSVDAFHRGAAETRERMQRELDQERRGEKS
jgi:gas vesicle protein